jgi:broad specificity phosphatase PhoE
MIDIDWLNEPSKAVKRIIFARHGEYECNVKEICNCDPRIPYGLTEKGQRQAIELGKLLKNEDIELIISSEFLRARQTAWLVNQSLNVPIVVNQLANENKAGEFLDGKPVALFQKFISSDPVFTAAEDGENFQAMTQRITKLLSDIGKSSPKTVLVICHGWPLQAARVLLKLCSPVDGANCIGMPSNCGIISGFYSSEMFTENNKFHENKIT